MDRRNALETDLQDVVDGLLGDAPPVVAEGNGKKATPHARKRVSRQMSVTFPNAGWTEAVQALARKWEVRNSDVLTFCVAYALRAVEDGLVEQPNVAPAQFHQRAGECMELMWEPTG